MFTRCVPGGWVLCKYRCGNRTFAPLRCGKTGEENIPIPHAPCRGPRIIHVRPTLANADDPADRAACVLQFCDATATDSLAQILAVDDSATTELAREPQGGRDRFCRVRRDRILVSRRGASDAQGDHWHRRLAYPRAQFVPGHEYCCRVAHLRLHAGRVRNCCRTSSLFCDDGVQDLWAFPTAICAQAHFRRICLLRAIVLSLRCTLRRSRRRKEKRRSKTEIRVEVLQALCFSGSGGHLVYTSAAASRK